MKKFIKISIIALLFVIKTASYTFAFSEQYMSNVLKPANIRAHYLLPTGDIVQKDRDAKTLVMFASDLKNLASHNTAHYENLLVLCLKDNIDENNCSRNYKSDVVNFKPLTYNSITTLTGTYKNMNVLMLDEGYLLSMKYSANANRLIQEFASKSVVSVSSKKADYMRDTKASNYLPDTFVVICLINLTLIYLYARTKFQLSEMKVNYHLLLIYLKKYDRFIKFLMLVFSIVFALSLIFFLILISYRDLNELNILYIFDYLKGIANLQNFKLFAINKSYVKILLQILYVLSTILFFGFLVIDAGKELSSVIVKRVPSGLSARNYWFLLLGHFTVIIIFSGVSNPLARFVLLFTLVSLILLFILGYIHKIDLRRVLSLRLTLFSLAVLCASLTTGLLIASIFSNKIRVTSEKEIVISRDYILPIEVGVNQEFNNEEYFKSNGTVLHNSLLVYHPLYKSIKNIPFSMYNDSKASTLIVFAFDEDAYLKELEETNFIPSFLTTENKTKYFSLEPEENNYEEMYGSFELDCSKIQPKSTYFTVQYVVKNKVESRKVMFFPGCKGESLEKITIPIQLPVNKRVYRIDFGSAEVVNYNLYKDDLPLKTVYYKDPSKNKLLYEVYGASDELYAYSIGIDKSISFKRSNDLINLNQLMQQTNINEANSKANIIWSFTDFTVLRLINNE